MHWQTFLSDDKKAESATSVVRVDALRNYREIVSGMGGDPDALLRSVQIDPDVLDKRHAVISYRMMVHLLERTAAELKCPDFGLRLAGSQGGTKVLGPLEVVMKNSLSVGDAFMYCAEHTQAYSNATQITFEPEPEDHRVFMRFEIMLCRLPFQRQAVEQALLLTHHAALDISGGRVHAREIWFSHEPAAPLETYRNHFGTIVRFGQTANGMFFSEADLRYRVDNPDPQLYELATSFINTRFPPTTLPISARVRALIGRQLEAGQCSNERVAVALGLHPRTMQRRLREEDQCFETIRDEVRRDMAMRYLRRFDLPLTRVAELLGYSEASVLSRSCYRWFAASPRQLRHELRMAAAPNKISA